MQRIISDPPPAKDLTDELVALRREGFDREAAVIELIVTTPDAAALTTWERRLQGRERLRTGLFYFAAMSSAGVLGLLHPDLVFTVPTALVGAAAIWFRRRRRAIGEEGWNLLVDWWLQPLRDSAPHQLLLLIFIGFQGAVAYAGLVESKPLQVLVACLIAVAAVSLWVRSRRGTDDGSITSRGLARASSIEAGEPPGREQPSLDDGPVVIAPPHLHLVMFAVVPLVLLSGMLLASAANQDSVFFAAALLVGAALVGWRVSRTSVRLSKDGVVLVGLIRTRGFRWDQIRAIRAKDDGRDRARVELLPVGQRGTTIWSGSIDHPVLPQLVDIGRSHASPACSPRRSACGCLTAVLWVTLAVGAVSVGGMLRSPALVPIDPAKVPRGVEVQRDQDDTGTMRGEPYVVCAPALREPDEWEPPGCADERDGQEAFMLVMTCVSVASAVGSVLVRRRARRADSFEPDGPIVR